MESPAEVFSSQSVGILITRYLRPGAAGRSHTAQRSNYQPFDLDLIQLGLLSHHIVLQMAWQDKTRTYTSCHSGVYVCVWMYSMYESVCVIISEEKRVSVYNKEGDGECEVWPSTVLAALTFHPQSLPSSVCVCVCLLFIYCVNVLLFLPAELRNSVWRMNSSPAEVYCSDAFPISEHPPL